MTAAAELFRRQGYVATGIKAILTAAEAPYGSMYHFFPGGKAELDGAQQTIRTVGTIASADALRDFSISVADGRAVRLSALATVSDGAADQAEAALLNGTPVVGFSL